MPAILKTGKKKKKGVGGEKDVDVLKKTILILSTAY